MAPEVIAEVVLRSPDAESDAVAALERRGVRVVQRGAGLLTISAEQPVFEQTFQTELSSSDGTHFSATQPPSVPDDLSDTIADVVLPSPPELFA
jgi:hypothetical protein